MSPADRSARRGSGTGSYILPDVTLVDPGSGGGAGTVSVRIKDGRIAEVFTGTRRTDVPICHEYRGFHVLPGLIDMHTHLPQRSPLHVTETVLLMQLAHGITTLRNAGDIDGTGVPEANRLIASGHPGPRISSAGAFVVFGEQRWPHSVQLPDPGAAADVVARIADEGHHWIKSYEGLDPARIRALVAAAERRGLGVIGHVPATLRIEEALIPDSQHFFGVPDPADLGADSVLCRASDWHLIDDRRLDEVVRASVANGMAHTPTLVTGTGLLAYRDYPAARRRAGAGAMPPMYADMVWHPRTGLPVYRGLDATRLNRVEHALRSKQKLLHALYREGVPLHLGTDTSQPFVVAGAALHTEMRLFHEAGIPAPDVWRMATTDAARVMAPHLGEPDLGTFAPGAPADLLLYRHDPTDGVEPGVGLAAVISRGTLHPSAALEEAVRERRRRHRRPVQRLLGWAGTRQSLRKITFDS